MNHEPEPRTLNPRTWNLNPEPRTPNPEPGTWSNIKTIPERKQRREGVFDRGHQLGHRRRRLRVVRLVERQPAADEDPALGAGVAAVDQPFHGVLRQEIDRGSAVTVLDESRRRFHPLN